MDNEITNITNSVPKTAQGGQTTGVATKSSSDALAIKERELAMREKELENKLKEADLKLRAAQLQDVEETLAERELKRETKRQRSVTNGQTLKQTSAIDQAVQKRCNHRKGGNGLPGLLAGQGHDSQYAILKHKFANGDWWIRCLRCGKTWKPPVKRSYKTEDEYRIAKAMYEQALDFQTNNTPSSSYVFSYSDNGEFYREVTEPTTLR